MGYGEPDFKLESVMASQGDYSAVANALVVLIHQSIFKLPSWEQGYIPMDKVPAAAGAAAKVAVDALDQYRAAHPVINQRLQMRMSAAATSLKRKR